MDPSRLRRLLALEIGRVVDDLERRRAFLVEVWGRARSRAPFLDSCFSRWRTLGFAELGALETFEVEALEAFYRELDELRLYLAHTEDMPQALRTAYDGATVRLRRLGDQALDAMGEGGAPTLEVTFPPGWWDRGGEE